MWFQLCLVQQCWQHTWNCVGGYLAGRVFCYNVTNMLEGVVSYLAEHGGSETWTNFGEHTVWIRSSLSEVVQIVCCIAV